MFNVKIIGAGSMWNHLSFAFRRIGCNITVVDISKDALSRMKNEIYPTRYWKWDKNIKLTTNINYNKWSYDIICICTPPDVRLYLAKLMLKEKPRILQLEKPLCTPNLKWMYEFLKLYNSQSNTKVIMWYNHSIGKWFKKLQKLLISNSLSKIISIDVEFRENRNWILKAHPRLSWPEDTYLGHTKKWWWASWEHSHALHFLIYLLASQNLWEINENKTIVDYQNLSSAKYDRITHLLIKTNKWIIWRVSQDVIWIPTQKNIYIRWQNRSIKREYMTNNNEHIIISQWNIVNKYTIKKDRKDDFYQEVLHIKKIINWKLSIEESPLNIEYGVKVMKLLNKIHSYRV